MALNMTAKSGAGLAMTAIVGAVNKMAWFAANREAYQRRLAKFDVDGKTKKDTEEIAIKYLLKST